MCRAFFMSGPSTFLALGLALGCASAIAEEDTPLSLQAFADDGARISALVKDLDTGKQVYARDPNLRLSPASISKLVTAAVALKTWDADLSLETRVLAAAPISEGRVESDLVLTGDGDATLDHRDLWQLAGYLHAAGLRRVNGAVVVEPPFGPMPCENQDRCDALLDSKNAYDAPLSSMAVDYGTWCIRITPGEPKSPATVRSCAGVALPIALEGNITTVEPRRRSSFRVIRQTQGERDRLILSGQIASERPVQVYRSMSDPALGMGQLFTQMLREQGIVVMGAASVRFSVTPFKGPKLAAIGGLPLREQVSRMNRFSNNFIADQLTLKVAAAQHQAGPGGLAEASQQLSSLIELLRPEASAPSLYSGSGLTPESRLSAGDMVALLEHMYLDSVNFPVFYGSLTVPEQSPFAFLGVGNEDWRRRLALKSGTLTEPDPVRTVAGYLRRKDGGWMALAVLVNGDTANRNHNNRRFMEAIRTEIEALLERY